MRLVIENIDDVIGRQIALSAAQHRRTMEEEVSIILSEKFSRMAMAEKLKTFHKKILDERGGIPFSDTVQIIREMRDNDHVVL